MIIQFGSINAKLLILFIYPIFYQIRRYIQRKSNPFYILFTEFLAYLSSWLIYVIIRDRKTSNPDQLNIIHDIENAQERREIRDIKNSNTRARNHRRKCRIAKKKEKKQYGFILLLIFINLIAMALEAFTSKNANINFKMASSLFYFMFFFTLFSRLILKQRLYNFHILSIFIIVICISLLITFYFINENSRDNLFINSLYLILVVCLYSLFDVLAKKYYNIFFDSPYHFMFVVGLISLSLLMLYESISLIITGVKDNDFNGVILQIKNNYNKYSFWYILIFVGDVISSFLWLAGIQLTMYFFTPFNFIISESISQIITTFIDNSLENYNIAFKIIIYIIYIIIIGFSCVYNEIIIINLCSLNYNTKYNIIKRAALIDTYIDYA